MNYRSFIVFSPYRLKNEVESYYFTTHRDNLDKCVDAELFCSAYSHLHLLYMMFVYLQLFRIARNRSSDFEIFSFGIRASNGKGIQINTPFDFSTLNESSVFNAFRIIGISYDDVSLLKKPIKNRNESLHANGIIHVSDSESFKLHLLTYLQNMSRIIKGEQSFIYELYSDTINEQNPDINYIVSENDIDLYFHEFSIYELKLLVKNKRDKFSLFLSEILK